MYFDHLYVHLQDVRELLHIGSLVDRNEELVEQVLKVVADHSIHDEPFQRRNCCFHTTKCRFSPPGQVSGGANNGGARTDDVVFVVDRHIDVDEALRVEAVDGRFVHFAGLTRAYVDEHVDHCMLHLRRILKKVTSTS